MAAYKFKSLATGCGSISVHVEVSRNHETLYWHEILASGNLRAQAIYSHDTISALMSRTQELVIDVTFGMNNSGLGLSAVLAELDGTGVPLCYLFYGNNVSDIASSSNVSGSSTSKLEQFLKPLRDAGFNQSFFGCDKDRAEITAIQKVWLGITVQLCFWHAKRAIKTKLQSLGKTSTQKQYLP